MASRVLSFLILSVALLSQPGWAHSPQFTTEFGRSRCTFVTTTSHPYFPLWPGYRTVLEGIDAEGAEVRSLYTVLPVTETVDGVATRVVEHREFEDDELIEITRDFYTVCRETGAVWYFGEDVDIYENGQIVGHTGAWRAGVNGAKEGIIMPGMPLIGARYYQEFAPGVAEDRGEIASVNETLTVPAGTFQRVLRIEDTDALNPTAGADTKWFGYGIGLIQDDVQKLVEIIPPPCLPDDTTLCLSNGRFRVQTTWREPQGGTGAGHGVTQSDDSGWFWFFSPGNTELTVKVLDTCAVQAFHNFWVFAAGMTNVQVTLTVTDTSTGHVKTYENPLNRTYETILDTAAFSTCQ